MGFYAPAQLVRDAREHGVTVLPTCVQRSGWRASLEVPEAPGTVAGPAVRLGLEQVHGLGEVVGRRIEAVRQAGPFASIDDLMRRCRLARDELAHLARAGALKALVSTRRQAVWESLRRQPDPGSMPLFKGLAASQPGQPSGGAMVTDIDMEDDLPPATPLEEVLDDYRTGGLSLTAHPLQFVRRQLAQRGAVTAAVASALPEGRRIMVAGLVLSRQRPATAKGTLFLSIEDESGGINVVVREGGLAALRAEGPTGTGGASGGAGAAAGHCRASAGHATGWLGGASRSVPCPGRTAPHVPRFLLTWGKSLPLFLASGLEPSGL